jgi:hypothetical protein
LYSKAYIGYPGEVRENPDGDVQAIGIHSQLVANARCNGSLQRRLSIPQRILSKTLLKDFTNKRDTEAIAIEMEWITAIPEGSRAVGWSCIDFGGGKRSI